jgi:hypothetical protein
MDSGLMMVVHSVIITVIIYLIMKYLLKQSDAKAMDRSILFGAVVLIYMVLFGHGMPTSINKNIMS